jgi:Arc/MetJ family transcription regulator
MRVTVTIEKDVLDELVKATGAKTKSAAVKIIIDEYLSERKVQKIMSMKGKLAFDRTADEIRHGEGEMSTQKKIIHDEDLAKVGVALRRAAKRAREEAERSNTPLIIFENGRVIKKKIVNKK